MRSLPGWLHLASFFSAILFLAFCGIVLDFPFTPKTLGAMGFILMMIGSPMLLSLIWGVTHEDEEMPPATGCLLTVFGWVLLIGLVAAFVLVIKA